MHRDSPKLVANLGPRPVPRAFTLVELLAVIAIISLLVAMLLPALSNARASARRVLCLSNLKQAGTMLNMYAGDYGANIPLNAHHFNGVNAWGQPYFELPNGTTEIAWGPSSKLRADIQGEFNYGGMGLLIALDYSSWSPEGARAFYCPSDEVRNYHEFGGWGYGWDQKNIGNHRWSAASNHFTNSSYVYGASRSVEPLRIGRYAEKVAMVDYVRNVSRYPQWSGGPVHNPHESESYAGYNRLFFDGHANFLSDANDVWHTHNVGVWHTQSLANHQGNWNASFWKENLVDE